MKQRTWQQSTDPRALLAHVGGAATVRKLRLFACACCRRGWHFAKDKRLEPLLLLLDEFADGTAKESRREPARERSYRITKADVSDSEHCLAWEIWGALRATFDTSESDLGESAAAAFGYNAGKGPEFYPAKQAERERQAVLVREIFGDPFRTVAADPAWRTDTARTLATQMYAAREFSAAPILADALQDAECDRADILDHLRDTAAVHYRGCWALDLVLGKE